MEIKLEAEDLCYSYHTLEGETKALSHISFDVRDGEFFAVVGPSGCGKSTLLSLLCGLIEPEEGRIFIDGKARQDSGAVIGYMLQRDHLFEWRSILSNVSLGLEIQNRLDHKAREELGKMLDTYGLSQFQDAKPGQLSGGMRQRAALIRTLALKPDILLLDEPFSALDYQTRLEVCDDISTIIRTQKKTAILITHDLSEAISVADRVLVLSSRPAKVRHVMEISFAPEFDRPLARRNAPEFSAYFNELWKTLKTEG
ncbi:MAG: ABC transporter ATP-binding protein [Hungatella sp.]|jgi:NitT/TauT family transport system ATP-binding protein|nr:ABC transporter ATP-binding protein [Hungatella sp.]